MPSLINVLSVTNNSHVKGPFHVIRWYIVKQNRTNVLNATRHFQTPQRFCVIKELTLAKSPINVHSVTRNSQISHPFRVIRRLTSRRSRLNVTNVTRHSGMPQLLSVIRRFTSRRRRITLIDPTNVLFVMDNFLTGHLFCNTKSSTPETSLTNAVCVVKAIGLNQGKFNTRWSTALRDLTNVGFVRKPFDFPPMSISTREANIALNSNLPVLFAVSVFFEVGSLKNTPNSFTKQRSLVSQRSHVVNLLTAISLNKKGHSIAVNAN